MTLATVVFVNHHGEELIAPRAAALAAAGHQVIVADNSGTYPEGGSAIVLPGENRGFAAGCNRALPSAQHDVVVFHNPDVDLAPGQVSILSDRVRRQGRPGLVAPALHAGDRIWENGFHVPSVAREAVLAAAVVRSRRRPPRNERATTGRRFAGRGQRFGSGALLAASSDMLRSIGGFDERYFLYVEDCDLWTRARDAGADCEFAPDVVAEHRGRSGSGATHAFRDVLRWVGVELWTATHRSWASRPMRWVHRAPVAVLARRRVPLAVSVQELFAAGATPFDVAVQVCNEVSEPGPPS